MPGTATNPCAEAMFTMEPDPDAMSAGSAARMVVKAAVKLTASTSSPPVGRVLPGWDDGSGDTGDVAQDVETPEVLVSTAHRGLHRLRVGHVGLDSEYRRTRIRLAFGDVDRHNGCAFGLRARQPQPGQCLMPHR